MGNRNKIKIFDIKLIVVAAMTFVLNGCCWVIPEECEDCFEDANLWFPIVVNNVEITRSIGPTHVAGFYYPNGTTIGVGDFSTYNEFFSVVKYDPSYGHNVTFFWNRDTPPGFLSLNDGERITFYKTVVNTRQDNSIDCLFQEVQEVKSILDVRVRTASTGEIVGTRQVEKTIFNIPSGQYGTFDFTFEFLTCGNYEFDIQIDPEGQLNESSVNDNNYSETQEDFGFCF